MNITIKTVDKFPDMFIPLGRELTDEEKMDPRMIRLIRSEKDEMVDPNTISVIRKIQATYGDEINCKLLLERLIGNMHRCPQCGGSGNIEKTIWISDPWYGHEETRVEECPLCHGKGYTEEEYIPNMVQDGWKVKQK